MRSLISSKSNTCTEVYDVYMAGISGKVCAQYPGRSAIVHRNIPVLSSPEAVETRRQKSAESIVECSTHSKARTGRTETETGISQEQGDTEATDIRPSAITGRPRRNREELQVVC